MINRKVWAEFQYHITPWHTWWWSVCVCARANPSVTQWQNVKFNRCFFSACAYAYTHNVFQFILYKSLIRLISLCVRWQNRFFSEMRYDFGQKQHIYLQYTLCTDERESRGRESEASERAAGKRASEWGCVCGIMCQISNEIEQKRQQKKYSAISPFLSLFVEYNLFGLADLRFNTAKSSGI